MSVEDLAEMQALTGFLLGHLPVRYLGVPLLAKRLTERECAPLIANVSKRVSGWAAKHLSFAGRAQLIQSVLFHVQNYWARHFLIPKAVLNKVKQICMRFLWSGSMEKTSSAKVAWSQVCLPKSECGWGLKDLHVWNKACLIQQLWYIIYRDGSLWIAWVRAYIIKGRDLMSLPFSSSCSWHWKKLLKLRGEAALVFQSVGASVVQQLPLAVIWKAIRPSAPKVTWNRVVWGPLHIPRYSFISWLSLLNRLPTKDRMRSWGMLVDPVCVLCSSADESRDHLFMDCVYTKSIWVEILRLCNFSRFSGTWSAELQWLTVAGKGQSLQSILLRLAWNAMVYWIWRERNSRLFAAEFKTVDAVLVVIFKAVRLKVLNTKFAVINSKTRSLCSAWQLS